MLEIPGLKIVLEKQRTVSVKANVAFADAALMA